MKTPLNVFEFAFYSPMARIKICSRVNATLWPKPLRYVQAFQAENECTVVFFHLKHPQQTWSSCTKFTALPQRSQVCQVFKWKKHSLLFLCRAGDFNSALGVWCPLSERETHCALVADAYLTGNAVPGIPRSSLSSAESTVSSEIIAINSSKRFPIPKRLCGKNPSFQMG